MCSVLAEVTWELSSVVLPLDTEKGHHHCSGPQRARVCAVLSAEVPVCLPQSGLLETPGHVPLTGEGVRTLGVLTPS